MNHTPIILLVGQAGSGKDTVAGFMVKNHGAISIAQADPMKRLGRLLFGFTDDQLWGPSESRNAIDPRFSFETEGSSDLWTKTYYTVDTGIGITSWIQEVLPGSDVEAIKATLKSWVNLVQSATYWAKRPLTPRFMLQTLGTEWGRNQSKQMWTDAAMAAAFKLLGGGCQYDRALGLSMVEYPGPDRVVISDGRFRNEIVAVLKAGGQVVRVDSPSIDGSSTEVAGVKGHASEKEQRGMPRHFFTGFFLNDKSKGLERCEQLTDLLVSQIDCTYFTVGRERGDAAP